MHRVSAAKAVLDPYEWLPGHGESSVTFRLDGADVVVCISYESENDSSSIVMRELRFAGVSSFYWSAFPGAAGLISVSYDTKWQIGSLIEFERSEVADAWAGSTPEHSKPRHFLIQFTSENRQLHAIAKSYSLSDEKR